MVEVKARMLVQRAYEAVSTLMLTNRVEIDVSRTRRTGTHLLAWGYLSEDMNKQRVNISNHSTLGTNVRLIAITALKTDSLMTVSVCLRFAWNMLRSSPPSMA